MSLPTSLDFLNVQNKLTWKISIGDDSFQNESSCL